MDLTPRPTATATPRPTATATPRPTATPTPTTCYQTWSSTAVYTGGMRVTHSGVNYEAKWWTQGNNPATNSCTDCVWRNIGNCGTTTPTPTTTARPTPTPTTTVRPTPTPTTRPTPTPTTGTPVSRNGQLRVCGLRLCNEAGQEVQLRGMSSHGIQWYGWGTCLTEASLDALANDWKADILRISLYVQEGGYESNPSGFTAQVDRLINEATERGMYALVDWHQLSPGDPMYNVDRAKTFFTHIAQTHGTKKNIIYDIANEPNGVTWARIRDYAHQVIPVIRAIDPDALILVGTHGWASLGVSDGRNSDDIVNAPINHSNIMYTFHFYAASHLASHRNEFARAADRIPLFVTEWGSQTYTGDGANDFVSAQAYIDLMTQKKISWTNWNYSDDFRSGAVWNQGACSSGNWSASNLKPAGQWVRDRIRNR